jgi:hypothetical protein
MTAETHFDSCEEFNQLATAQEDAPMPPRSSPPATEKWSSSTLHLTTAGTLPLPLSPEDIAAFKRLGILPSLLTEAGIRRVSDVEARSDFGIKGSLSQDMSGIVFPYFSPVTGKRTTARVRRDHPEFEHGKPKNKYISPWGDARHLYFPPGAAEKLRKPDMAIALVEAEKSALALTAWASRVGMDLLPVAMGGCWGWRGRVGKAESADGSRVDVLGPLPDLSVCDQHRVYVVMDANVAGNAKVQQAEKALAIFLAEHKCDVQLRHLPQFDGVNGPDDLLAVRGDDALRMALMTPICSNNGPGILEAAMEAIADEIYTSNMERFYAFCVALQRLRGTQAVALPVERIGALMGCHWSTIATYRRQAVIAGWLQHAGNAVPHVRAATFFVKLPILTNSDTALTKNKTKQIGEDSSDLPSLSGNLPLSLSEKSFESLGEKNMTSLSGEEKSAIVRKPHSEDSEVAWL